MSQRRSHNSATVLSNLLLLPVRLAFYPFLLLDYLCHLLAQRLIVERWENRNHEFGYLLVAPPIAVCAGFLLDPILFWLFPEWTLSRRLAAFAGLSAIAWTGALVRLFDASTYAYRYTRTRRRAALWAHALLWLSGLLFHPVAARSDTGIFVLFLFGATTVVWHFADWWTPPPRAQRTFDPVPLRPNPYEIPLLPLPSASSSHADWLFEPASAPDASYQRGPRLLQVGDIEDLSIRYWEK